MKKYFFTNNERGFILPIVLFVSFLLLLKITTLLLIYQNELRIYHNMKEQLLLENIVYTVREELSNLNDDKLLQLDNTHLNVLNHNILIQIEEDEPNKVHLTIFLKHYQEYYEFDLLKNKI